jgi:hypothetical protein
MGGLHNTSTLIGGDGKGLDLYPASKVNALTPSSAALWTESRPNQ